MNRLTKTLAIIALAAFAQFVIILGLGSAIAQTYSVTEKNITVENSWARASASKHAAAGFMTITSQGVDDVLLAVKSDLGKKTEIHLSSMDDNGVMHMLKQKNLPIPDGKAIILKPGSFHIMFMKLHDYLREGDVKEIELIFEKAGSVTVQLPVKKAGHKMNHGS